MTPHVREQVSRFVRLFVVTFVSSLLAAVQALPPGTGLSVKVGGPLVVAAAVAALEVTWRQIRPALPPGLPPPATAALAPMVGLLERVATAVEGLGPTTVNVHPAIAAAEPSGPALTSTGAVFTRPLAPVLAPAAAVLGSGDAAADILTPAVQPVAGAGPLTAVPPTVGQVVQ